MNQIDLNGHVAIVTGGAQGIGQSVVERFAASGATVEIWDLDGDLAEETANEIGGTVAARAVDVTTSATAPSDSWQQSSRRSGSMMKREL